MENKIQLSVILPAYLEEENLRLLLPRVKQTIQGLTDRHEILVIDTMKPLDGTNTACRELAATERVREDR